MFFPEKDLVPEKKKKTGMRKILAGIALGAALSQGAVFLIHSLWIFPWKAGNHAMEPGVKYGEKLYINRLFNPESLKRGDLVILAFPENPEKKLLRRVIGLPGDTVEIRSRKVYINGRPYHHETEIPVQNSLSASAPFERNVSAHDDMPVKQILKNELFVLADNRNHAMDSRHTGPFPFDFFIGRAY